MDKSGKIQKSFFLIRVFFQLWIILSILLTFFLLPYREIQNHLLFQYKLYNTILLSLQDSFFNGALFAFFAVGILVFGGFSKFKALMWNFISGLTALIGGLGVYFLASQFEGVLVYLMGLSAGSFIYIAGVDLIPHLHEEKELKKSLIQFGCILGGILVIVIFSLFLHLH